jgi:hypothetical protein
LQKCGLIGPSNRSGSPRKIGATLFALPRAWCPQGWTSCRTETKNKAVDFVDNSLAKSRDLSTARPFAHKLHSLIIIFHIP